MNLVSACSPVVSSAASAEFNTNSSIFPATVQFFSSYWKLLLKSAVVIEGLPPDMLINVLCWRLSTAGCNDAFVVMILFSASTAAFLTRISLWFPWWLVSFGSISGTYTPSDINNSLLSGLKLLKNVATISNRNPYYCRIASILKRNRVLN